MRRIVVGMAGAGWAGAMHARSYRAVHGIDCRLKTVCALDEGLDRFAAAHGFAACGREFDDLLADREIDVVDIVTPPALHADMVVRALAAGKHVICEKPLTGYFGNGQGDEGPGDGETMLTRVMTEADRIGRAIAESGRVFCYAENWIYSPPFRRMMELLLAKKTEVLLIEGATGHSGSHARHANHWRYNGGGSLIRQGTHPVAAALHLKRREIENRGGRYGIAGIRCDCARLSAGLKNKGHIAAAPVDVEDWARVGITFSDGSRADIMAGDMLLGHILNRLEAHGNDASYRCNMTPNNLLESYHADDRGIENMPIMEKSSHNLGGMRPLVAEEFIRGYQGQLQDFLESIAHAREPESGFRLARETLAVIYAAYWSAQSDRTIDVATLF